MIGFFYPKKEKANAMFGVKGFPWIALFKDGVPSRYKGQRIHRKIINYMYRRIHTPFREIKDINGAISIKGKIQLIKIL